MDEEQTEEMERWINKKGSKHLKRALKEGYNVIDVYRTARLKELGRGWVYTDNIIRLNSKNNDFCPTKKMYKKLDRYRHKGCLVRLTKHFLGPSEIVLTFELLGGSVYYMFDGDDY